MSRHYRHIAEEMYELTLRLPWWGGLLSAFAVYALLHPLASLQMPTPEGVVDVATTSLAQLVVMLARIGQYVIPLGLLLAAAISAFSRWKRSDLRYAAANDATGTLLRGIRRADFELLAAEIFRDQGYRTAPTHDDLRTGAADLAVTRDGQRYLVQCRNWKASTLDVEAVRDLQAAVTAAGADGGFAVTSGRFTPEARRFARGSGIELIDGRGLKELIRSNQGQRRSKTIVSEEKIVAALHGMKDLAHTSLDRWNKVRRNGTAAWTAVDASASEQRGRTEPRLDASMDAQETIEEQIGQKLTALIRSEGNVSDPAVAMRATTAPAPPGLRPQRSPKRFKLRISKVADLGGILLTSAGIWAGYQWFQSLPEKPAGSPWSLLGSGRTETGSKPITSASGPTEAVVLEQRPLGQFNFGGTWELEAAATAAREQEEKPVVVYRSLWQLEAAFNGKYIPPPDCYDWESNAEMVRCANHRMRARRAFIDSGGKLSAELFGATSTPGTYPQPAPRKPIPVWRLEQEHPATDPEGVWERTWHQAPENDANLAQRPSLEWEPHTTPAQEVPWRRERQEDPSAEPAQDWRTEQDLRPQDDWRNDPERRSQTDWRQESDWRSPTDWRREQDRASQQGREQVSGPQENWSEAQDWRRPEYSPPVEDGLREPDPFQNPARDWHQEPQNDR